MGRGWPRGEHAGGPGTQHMVGSSQAGDSGSEVARSYGRVSWDVEVRAGVDGSQ